MDEQRAIDEVRAAVERVTEADTAWVSFELDFGTRAGSSLVHFASSHRAERGAGGPERAVWSVLRRAAVAGERRLSDAFPTTLQGTVAFTDGTVRLHGERGRQVFEQYREPGLALRRRGSGRWRMSLQSEEGTKALTPVGLVESLRGFTNISESGPELINGIDCRRLDGICDGEEAARRSVHGLDPGMLKRDQETRLTVWLGADGFIHQVSCVLAVPNDDGSVPVVQTSAKLTLTGFGTALAPQRPDPADVDGDWGKTFRLTEPILSVWVDHVNEILPDQYTIRSAGTSVSISAPGGGSVGSLVGLGLLVPGTPDQKLRRLFRSLAEQVQEFMAKPLSGPSRSWPGPSPEAHVVVSAEQVEVWWTSPGEPAIGGTRPIEPASVRIRPIPRSELGI